jgi:hypothetical protein
VSIISNGKFSVALVAERLDAEFFDPADLALIKKLEKNGAEPLGTLCDVFNGKTPEIYVPNEEIPIVRSGNLVARLIYPDCGQDFLRAKKTSKTVFLRTGDVLISSIGMGSIGKISLVMNACNFATVSEVTVLRSKGVPTRGNFCISDNATWAKTDNPANYWSHWSAAPSEIQSANHSRSARSGQINL